MQPDTGPLIDRIRDYLKVGAVSFAELSRHVDGFDGEGVLAVDANNIVLWAEISYEAADAVRQLLAAGDCYAEPASPLVYMLDGFSLNLPLAQRAVAYKTPHWLPVTLN